MQQARKLLAPKLLAWGWLNLESVRKIPQSKEFFETPPARTTIETSALPVKAALVLVDLIGYVPGEIELPG